MEELNSNTENSLLGASFDGVNEVTMAGNSGVILISKDGGKTFNEIIREDRLGNVSIAHAQEGQLVLVGESGVNLINSAGQNL